LGAANPPSFFRYSSLAQLHSLDAFFFLYGWASELATSPIVGWDGSHAASFPFINPSSSCPGTLAPYLFLPAVALVPFLCLAHSRVPMHPPVDRADCTPTRARPSPPWTPTPSSLTSASLPTSASSRPSRADAGVLYLGALLHPALQPSLPPLRLRGMKICASNLGVNSSIFLFSSVACYNVMDVDRFRFLSAMVDTARARARVLLTSCFKQCARFVPASHACTAATHACWPSSPPRRARPL
jgi:hypothetical protein